ncbi:hypothetical protein D3C78_1373730 [compost metagenome]
MLFERAPLDADGQLVAIDAPVHLQALVRPMDAAVQAVAEQLPLPEPQPVMPGQGQLHQIERAQLAGRNAHLGTIAHLAETELPGAQMVMTIVQAGRRMADFQVMFAKHR